MRSLKAQLRHRLRSRRKATSILFQEQCAQHISTNLCQSTFFQRAKHVALYAPFDGEVLTTFILEQALLSHKYCYLPILSGRHLEFVQIDDQTSLQNNRFGIKEPSSHLAKMVSGYQLDLVLLPLVAFDQKGHRLGMGGGYYDRTFGKKPGRPPLVGLAYDFQRVSFVPHTGLDVTLNAIVTEKQLYLPLL